MLVRNRAGALEHANAAGFAGGEDVAVECAGEIEADGAEDAVRAGVRRIAVGGHDSGPREGERGVRERRAARAAWPWWSASLAIQ